MMMISSVVVDAAAWEAVGLDEGTFGPCVSLCRAVAVGVTFVPVGSFVVIVELGSVGVAVGSEPTSVVEVFDD